LARSVEGLDRLLSAIAARRDQRRAIGQLPLHASLAPRRLGFDCLVPLQNFQQRLRLADLGHFRRRRETFRRVREDVMRFKRAVGGLEELRQSKRCLERECALFLGDLKGVTIRDFSLARIAHGEDVAAEAMQPGVHPMAGGLFGQFESFRDRDERVIDRARRTLQLSEKAVPDM
jgi:hypothetical protein